MARNSKDTEKVFDCPPKQNETQQILPSKRKISGTPRTKKHKVRQIRDAFDTTESASSCSSGTGFDLNIQSSPVSTKNGGLNSESSLTVVVSSTSDQAEVGPRRSAARRAKSSSRVSHSSNSSNVEGIHRIGKGYKNLSQQTARRIHIEGKLMSKCYACRRRRLDCIHNNRFGFPVVACDSCTESNGVCSHVTLSWQVKRVLSESTQGNSSHDLIASNKSQIPTNEITNHSDALHHSMSIPEGIECSNQDCLTKWFSKSFLEEHCGIDLETVKKSLADLRQWFCPTCQCKNENTVPAIERIPSRYGRATLDREALLELLNKLSIKMKLYTHRFSKMPLGNQTIRNLPIVRKEIIDENRGGALRYLRNLFSVPDKVLLKDHLKNCGLEAVSCLTLICGVVSLYVQSEGFGKDLCFDDTSVWVKVLQYGFSDEVARLLIQDYKLRTVQELSFKKASQHQVKSRSKVLNSLLLPLIRDKQLSGDFSQLIASIMIELNTEVHAYDIEFEGILPRFKDKFNPKFHEVDQLSHDAEAPSQNLILMAVLPGFKYKVSGKDWCVLAKAKVVLWDLP